jgi:hypothetical protein
MTMFEVFCPSHQARVLLSTGRIEAVRNTPRGVIVEWKCWCGHQGRSLDGRTLVEAEPMSEAS